jgi:hypothetical protein
MRQRAWFAIAISAAIVALVWALSPTLFGQREPWDARGGLGYVGALVVGGLLAGAIVPRPLWGHYLGAVGGQLAYELIFLGFGSMFPAGALLLLVYSLPFVIAAALTGFLRERLRRAPAV